MLAHHIRMGEGGRIIIPSEYRQALAVKAGDALLLQLDAGELRLVPQSEALKRLREAAKTGKGDEKTSHTDDFPAFRKRDSK